MGLRSLCSVVALRMSMFPLVILEGRCPNLRFRRVYETNRFGGVRVLSSIPCDLAFRSAVKSLVWSVRKFSVQSFSVVS